MDTVDILGILGSLGVSALATAGSVISFPPGTTLQEAAPSMVAVFVAFEAFMLFVMFVWKPKTLPPVPHPD